MLTHDYVRGVTSVITSPWKYGKRVEIKSIYTSIVVAGDEEQLCCGQSVLIASHAGPAPL